MGVSIFTRLPCSVDCRIGLVITLSPPQPATPSSLRQTSYIDVGDAAVASHVDVLRLVTWEERVTSLRSSAWEANTAVDRPALHLSNRLDKSPS